MERAEQIGRTEAVYREVNEAIAETAAGFDGGAIHLVCECGDAECADRVTTDVETYERVRAHATRFILVPGHEENALERVVERRAGYTIVEKFERTVARIARSLNPRASAA